MCGSRPSFHSLGVPLKKDFTCRELGIEFSLRIKLFVSVHVTVKPTRMLTIEDIL